MQNKTKNTIQIPKNIKKHENTINRQETNIQNKTKSKQILFKNQIPKIHKNKNKNTRKCKNTKNIPKTHNTLHLFFKKKTNQNKKIKLQKTHMNKIPKIPKNTQKNQKYPKI